MKKNILLILLLAMLVNLPALKVVAATDGQTEMAQQSTEIVFKSNSTVCIRGAQGHTLYVYPIIGGRPLRIVKIEGDEVTLNLQLSKGCYLLSVNGVARKVNIR